MQRLPAAALLAALAVCLTAGCVAVPPAGAGRPPGSSRHSPSAPSVEPAGPEVGPRSYEKVTDTRPDDHRPGHHRDHRAGGRAPAAPAHPRGFRPAPAPAPRARRLPAGARRLPLPRHRHSLPRVPAGTGGTDPCALGRVYGHWASGSQANRICSGAYGH